MDHSLDTPFFGVDVLGWRPVLDGLLRGTKDPAPSLLDLFHTLSAPLSTSDMQDRARPVSRLFEKD